MGNEESRQRLDHCDTCELGQAWRKITDEIKAEIAEKFIDLPVDADGVPIHLGDTLEIKRGGSTDIGEVTDIHLQEGKCAVSICFEYDSAITAYPEDYRHVQPDAVDSLLEEYRACVLAENPSIHDNDVVAAVRKDCAERIRKVV